LWFGLLKKETGKWVNKHAEKLCDAWTLPNVLSNKVCLMAAILYVSGIAQMGTLAQAVHQQSFNLTAHRCIVAAV